MYDAAMYDAAIIGGGLSGGLTLIYLLEELQAAQSHPPSSPNSTRKNLGSVRLIWLDGNADFGRGIAYGRAAHPKFLMNNDVSCMNVGGFHAWLSDNRSCWTEVLEREADPAVKQWLGRHRESLQAAADSPHLYLPMFLPRFVFGMFLSDWLTDSLDRARRMGVNIDLSSDNAVAARRHEGMMHVATSEGSKVAARTLILCLGSLPPDPNPALRGLDDYIHQWSMPDGGASLCKTVVAKNAVLHHKVSALIVGSNSSAIEALYTIANDSALLQALRDIRVISPSGRLPCAASGRQPDLRPRHLEGLQTDGSVSADDLIGAVLADFAQGQKAGFTFADCSDTIIRAFRKIFSSLPADQKRRFVENFGSRFTALSRHTPPDYADAVAGLRAEGKLVSIAAEVVDVRHVDNHFVVAIRPSNQGDEAETVELSADVVINCSGSGRLSRSADPLLRSLFDNGLARINPSGQGIAVSSNFEASPGVFVVGPLLAGHSGEPFHLWNLERAERIDALAKHAAKMLAQRILTWQEPASSAL